MDVSLLAAEAGTSIWSFGLFWAMLGSALAFLLAGAGSAKGVMLVGSAGAGLLAEDPKKFVSCLVLEVLPSTQGIYGFVIAFLIMNRVDFAAGVSLETGLGLFCAALPVGIVGLVSAIMQGRVAASSIGIVAKRPKDWSKGVILALSVELFALFGFLVSILMVMKF